MPFAVLAGKKSCDVSENLIEMMEAMSYNKKVFSVIGDDYVVTNENLKSISVHKISVAVGHCGFSKKDVKLSVKGEVFLAYDGYFTSFMGSTCNDEDYGTLIADAVNKRNMTDDLSKAISTVMRGTQGAFSLIAKKGSEIIIVQDAFGFLPMYWGENDKLIAVASEKKALWKIGLKDVAPLLGGYMFALKNGERSVSKIHSFDKPSVVDFSLGVASERIIELLKNVFSRSFFEGNKAGLLFSGGVDSSVLAKISLEMGLNIKLYGVAVDGASDIDIIEKSASELGCELVLQVLSLEQVEAYLRKTVYAVENADLMSVGIGLPIYAALEVASGDGSKLVISGQGADELFGGYFRYRRIASQGNKQLSAEMWSDILTIGKVNLLRDGAVAMANNVYSFAPYLDLEFVNFAMSLPTSFKVKDPQDSLRKHVLREAAKRLDISEEIIYRPKRAIQYSSGSDLAIKKLAKRRGKGYREYIVDVFKEVFKNNYTSS